MPRIQFHNLEIDKVASASGVFSGDNVQVDWTNVSKTNEGNGTVSGDDNFFYNGRHIVVGRKQQSNDQSK